MVVAVLHHMFHRAQMQSIYDAIDSDDSIAVERILRSRNMSCGSIEGLLDRAAGHGKIASVSSLIDILDQKGCASSKTLDEAAKEAVLSGEYGAVLFLMARGASNYDELIDLAERSSYPYIATLVKQKIGAL